MKISRITIQFFALAVLGSGTAFGQTNRDHAPPVAAVDSAQQIRLKLKDGTTVTVWLPAPPLSESETQGLSDE